MKTHSFGPWAVITGASDGIGMAFAHELGAAGINLVVVARREERLRELSAQLSATFGISVRVLAADLGSTEGNRKLFKATADLEVGILVCAAGFGTSGEFIRSSVAEELNMIDVNCRSVAEQCHYFGNLFAKQNRGAIVLMASLVGFQGAPYAANYAATKAFIQSLAEGLRFELRPYGVEVIASAPGPVQSGFAARAGMVMGASDKPEMVARQTLRAIGHVTTVRPGFFGKVLGFSLIVLPRLFRVLVMKKIMRSMADAT